MFVTLLFLGKGNNLKDIGIKEISEVIGEEKASALLGFHALSGSDFISKFNGILKATCWKIFNESNALVRRIFPKIGETNKLPMQKSFYEGL